MTGQAGTHTSPVTYRGGDLRCDPIIILLSCPPARTVIVAWVLTTHCRYQENIGLSKLNRMKNSGSRWKAWHWNVVGSWRGCWWIWINITPGPVSTTALTWGMRLGVMEAHCDFFYWFSIRSEQFGFNPLNERSFKVLHGNQNSFLKLSTAWMDGGSLIFNLLRQCRDSGLGLDLLGLN